ncbi:MerR family transcriptional regulator [Streptomyces inhibens]|uniref:MerR family transcriptional regulator n=1 Tax=Streptomyces inhibens TaxID=2293571 RepID=UPI00378B91CB
MHLAIHSARRANGYREYDDQTVETVRRIRALLAAGLPTRIIRQVLDRRAADLETARRLLRQTIAAIENAANQRRCGRRIYLLQALSCALSCARLNNREYPLSLVKRDTFLVVKPGGWWIEQRLGSALPVLQ